MWAAGLLYSVCIWIPPWDVLLQLVEKQFVPLALGMLLARFLLPFSAAAQVWMNRLGNVVRIADMVAAGRRAASRPGIGSGDLAAGT